MPHVLAVPLSGRWHLSWSEDAPESLLHDDPRGHLWLPARVPAPVHVVLQEAGLSGDPNFGMESLRTRWVEEQFWIYRKSFSLPEKGLQGSQWLVFDWLEHVASIGLNGEEVGRHANSHRRAVIDVTGKLRAGENLLTVVVETGLHHVHDVPVDGYAFDRLAQRTRRPLLRKAQYQCGWDWNPRLMNVGILGDVRLEASFVPVLDQVSVLATVDETLTRGRLIGRVFLRHPKETFDETCHLMLRIPELNIEKSIPVDCSQDGPAVTEHTIDVEVERPELWWPVGHGPQNLYDIQIVFEAGGTQQERWRQTGFRRVELDQSPHPEGGRHFVIRVNNRPIFCKGGNWVPPDLMPSRVPATRYEALVQEAVSAHFNTLRVWGGGVFAPEPLLDACDRHGVLIWHDFLFACARYPGDDPAFTAEVEKEVTEGVRRMNHHPSLVVWCGNNEVEWGDREWGYGSRRPIWPHHALFHHHIPSILQHEDGSRVYWPSSPWSPDFAPPNDPTVGDQHPWGVSILDPGPADFHRYRTYVDRFPNEGGVLGAGLPVTLREFLPEHEQHLLSPSWVHHDNPIAFRASRPGAQGRVYETFRYWTGLDPFTLDLEEYALLSGLLQAEGLCEYIANYRRRMFRSASAIFWMYNDSWPVSHSWTIVDYHLRRRLSYHPVRRAFQPVTVVVADEGDEVVWYGVNETNGEWQGTLRYGFFHLAGGYPEDRHEQVTLPPNCALRLAHLPKKWWVGWDPRRTGAFGVLLQGEHVLGYHRLFLHRFCELEFEPSPVKIARTNGQIECLCDTFAWGVCWDISGSHQYADNCFDLLPKLRYTLPWPGGGDVPEPVWIGSEALMQLRRRQGQGTRPVESRSKGGW